MKSNTKKKEFDAVKMMRDIRDQLDRKIANMTYAEEKAYLKSSTSTQPAERAKVKREMVRK